MVFRSAMSYDLHFGVQRLLLPAPKKYIDERSIDVYNFLQLHIFTTMTFSIFKKNITTRNNTIRFNDIHSHTTSLGNRELDESSINGFVANSNASNLLEKCGCEQQSIALMIDLLCTCVCSHWICLLQL